MKNLVRTRPGEIASGFHCFRASSFDWLVNAVGLHASGTQLRHEDKRI